MIKQLQEVAKYKHMLVSSVKKDLRSRYRGSVLGFLWTFINPLTQLIIYSIVFPYLLRTSQENYPMYVFTALLPWIYFVSSLQNSTTCIVANSNLVKKIYFPRLVLPIAVSTTGIVNYIFGLVIVIPSLIITGVKITPFILLLPLIMIVNYIFVTGFCFILSSLYVYFRDLEHIIGIITLVWFYLTPVVYGPDMFPENIWNILKWNPMTQFISAYRNVLMFGKAPETWTFVVITIMSLLLFYVGTIIFDKLQKNFAEEL